MKITSKDLLETFPDVSEIFEMQARLRVLLVRKVELEEAIRQLEADIIKKAISDPKYFVNGKPPSMSLIEKLYLVTGLDDGGELSRRRLELGKVVAEIEELKSKIFILHSLFDLWRSLSASERV